MGELREREAPARLPNGRLRAGAPERGAGSEEQAEILVALRVTAHPVGSGQQARQLDERRDANAARLGEKRPVRIDGKPERTLPDFIIDPQ